jgi:hypothetical protein
MSNTTGPESRPALRPPSPGDTMTRHLPFALFLSTGLLLVSACSSSPSGDVPDDAGGSCSSVPAPRSGPRRVDELPSGACSVKESCALGAHRTCACSELGPYDVYQCECDGAVWRCTVTSRAASVCSPCPDASTSDADRPD